MKGDVRLIKSMQFATAFSLRFPRVTRVRFDKGPQDTMTHQELLEDVEKKRAGGARAGAACAPCAALQGGLWTPCRPLSPAVSSCQTFTVHVRNADALMVCQFACK